MPARHPTTTVVRASLLAAALLLTACGSDADQTTAATSPSPAASPATTTPEPEPTPEPTPEPPARDPQTFGVDVFDFGYTPDASTILVGDTITWTHVGDINHTVTFSGGGPDSGTMRTGDTYRRTFDAPGTFSYRCLFHSQMQGTVQVG